MPYSEYPNSVPERSVVTSSWPEHKNTRTAAWVIWLLFRNRYCIFDLFVARHELTGNILPTSSHVPTYELSVTKLLLEVLTVIFEVMTSCSTWDRCQCFGATCSFHLQDSNNESWDVNGIQSEGWKGLCWRNNTVRRQKPENRDLTFTALESSNLACLEVYPCMAPIAQFTLVTTFWLIPFTFAVQYVLHLLYSLHLRIAGAFIITTTTTTTTTTF